ncbi:hypothetical protein ABH946_002203 [Bacillus sp. RC145]|uniref:hypothetical protein n=1 Tax=Bacillus TaxID=1386 RepID=UPI000BFA36E2|nr:MULTISPECIES: hypothetical protein [Bacillus cereus group]KAB2474373.1 hypothetical protein F8159_28315 [Bacillus cereus]PFN04680.1 hypothetical protein COJ51_14710 [Bacillus thuringiensis]PGN49613.1 hypothetical protein CN962_07735 [Bacillus cereus]
MKVINKNTIDTGEGSVTAVVVETTEPIIPAKHTSLKDIRKMAGTRKTRRGILQKLGINHITQNR